MSKPSRRRQRPGSQPSTPPTSGAPAARPAASGVTPASTTTTGPAGATGTTGGATATTAGATTRPVTGARAGRRERQRITHEPSFLERYRTVIVVVAALAGVAILSGLRLHLGVGRRLCLHDRSGAPPRPPRRRRGRHPPSGTSSRTWAARMIRVGDKVTYTYCAPASGSHYNKPGIAGPIPARVYGPNDNVIPEGWIHNLEHGGLVLLYTSGSSGATVEGQAQLKAFYDAFPPGPVCGTPKGVIGPVIARFDQMSTPFQAIVWGRVLMLDAFDQAKILAFWEQWGERTNPEKQCAAPSAGPSATPSGPATPASVAPSPS